MVLLKPISETAAQKRAEIYFKTRFPSKIGKIKEISLLEEPTDDIVKEYRVSIVFESGDLFNEISK
jgi:hypothetical protein